MRIDDRRRWKFFGGVRGHAPPGILKISSSEMRFPAFFRGKW